MISIKHEKVSTKPPFKKSVITDIKTDKSSISNKSDVSVERLSKNDPPRSEQIDAMIENIGYDIKKLQTMNDLNQNVIEPNSCSFEQLCSMINDLEENIAGHGVVELRLDSQDDFISRNMGKEGNRFCNMDRGYLNNQARIGNLIKIFIQDLNFCFLYYWQAASTGKRLL